ncbi:MAG: outer membrane protein assembly factor BamB/predicted nucleic acid-binding protein [Spirosomataceae bacterium]|jgi:outer membrane protein assembly factor BamB/predicted nucleic acid-binding protein
MTYKTTQLLLSLLCCVTFTTFSQSGWVKNLATIGTFSSPRVSDLNKDGVKDIILGAGRLEFQACDSAVVAINGKDGQLMWQVSASDQIFGSAIFQDITGDEIDDVFIGGRSAELMGIDGSNGNVLWRFLEVNKESNITWFNFYNPQFVADQDGDGLPDLLVSNGGDVFAEPHDPNRSAGYLLVISSQTGKLLAKAVVPDGKETYLSPVVLNSKENKDTEILFGTGGETVGGGFYIASLQDVINEDLSNAVQLDSCADKGYIGPPVRVDINEDGILDILTNSVNGRLLAFDGKDHHRIWEAAIPNTESYSSITIGNFNGDKIPDMFVSYGRGIWPNLDWSVQMMVNGSTGEIEFTDSLGFYQNTTPLAVDVTGDGIDEIVMSLNFQKFTEYNQRSFYNSLIVIEFGSREVLQITNNLEGSNLSSTPWIGDLDDNGFLDILYCHSTNLQLTYKFDGMKLHRIETQIPVYNSVKWGAYQGSNYDGIYSAK